MSEAVHVPAPQVIGYYRDEHAVVAACAAARAAGHDHVEAVSPYPIHGIDPVLGIGRSWIGRPVLLVILIGFVIAYTALSFNQTIEWPIIVSGMPYGWWVGFVVLTLESGLLLGALVNMGAAMHALRALPLPVTDVLHASLTDDTFAVVIPVTAPFTADGIAGWLRDHGAERIEQRVPVIAPATAAPGEVAHG